MNETKASPGDFSKTFTVVADDIDGFGHVNNVVYLRWLDATVWAHTRHVGLSEDRCLALNRGMAAIRHEIDYLAAARLGDEVVVTNWIAANDGKLRATRHFYIVRPADETMLLRAKTDYVCTNLTTGRPARMPPVFITAYANESANTAMSKKD
ncbi:MAG: thioesterase family protein [Pseudomonadota bacterium]